jgi:hypothetical protein
MAWLHGPMDQTAYDALWLEGCGMTMEQAVAYALEDSGVENPR